MITWGISANSHDAALAVFVDNKLVFASHSERFSGIKNDAHLNYTLIAYARTWGEPDEVIWYEKPFRKTLRQLRAGQGWRYSENNIKRYLEGYGISAPIRYSSHHHSHAAAGYYTSPFDNATVVCIDSIGEFETLSVWNAQGDNMKRVYSQGYPHSVGLWYSAMTQRVGLKPNEDEYILMGMAAYGDPSYFYEDIRKDLIDLDIRNGYKIKLKQNLHRGCKWWKPEITKQQDMFHIAAGTQAVYEQALSQVLHKASKDLPSRNLVLMGGCALNCSANGLAYQFFDNVWIMPNPGDAGSAVGAVLAHKKLRIELDNVYLGYNIEGEYPVKKLLRELKKNGIVGVANGPAEYGPRALGNRSLLADPRTIENKKKVNEIKQRQQFRPFAPAILEEYVDEYFEGPTGPYMQFTARCKDPDMIPAVIHQDGTSRVQVVKNDGSGFRRLLEEWHKQTGCPVLLNTSLNIKGKPMVNDESDAKEFAKKYGIKVY